MAAFRTRRIVVVGLALATGGLIVVGSSLGGWPLIATGLRPHLRQRGVIVVVGDPELGDLAGEGTVVRSQDAFPSIADALQGTDGKAVRRAMESAGVGMLLVQRGGGTEEKGVADRLRRYEHVDGLRGDVLDPVAALYVADDLADLPPPLDDVVAHVARRLLAGDAPPRIASFPEPLRRVRNVEVMVMLRQRGIGGRGAARLWRSARGSSVARALVTASVVARQRWEEREQSMGEPLEEILDELAVEVVLLQEDGTLLDPSRAFIEVAFHPEHGVAYERRGAWRYTLPDPDDPPTSAYEAYRSLLREHGLELEALRSSDLRAYRLVATPVARSAGSESGGPSLELDDLAAESPSDG